VSVGQYAKSLGLSRRTIQRYISNGMPTIKGTHKSIHLPTVNKWWEEQAVSKGGRNE
jgi:predicted transcriptional regulator